MSDGTDNGSNDWKETLPEDIRTWEEVQNAKTPDDFYKWVKDARSYIGQSIRIPSEEAGKEDWKAFHSKLREKVPTLMPAPDPENEESVKELYRRLGMPEKPDEYEIPEIKGLDGEPIKNLDMSQAEMFREVAHKTGLTKKQYKEIVEAITKQNLQVAEQQKKFLEEERQKVEKEWGAATEQNFQIVDNFLKKADAPDSIKKALEQKLLPAETVAWLHNLATKTMGSKSEFLQDKSNEGVLTPTEAKLKISEILNNKEHPYWKKEDPGHEAARKLMRELTILSMPKTGKEAAPGSSF